MAINGIRNKRIGPGGSTRRLHQIRFPAFLLPPHGAGRTAGPAWGRNRLDERLKASFSLGMVPPISDHYIVANDNDVQAVAA